MRFFTRIVPLVLIAGFAACGDDSSAKIVKINREAGAWVPASEVARPGDIVIWRNNAVSDMKVKMTTAPNVESGVIKLGQAFEWQIPGNQPEELLRYEDDFAPSIMGSITISKAAK